MGSDEVISAWLARFLRRRDGGETEAQEARLGRAAAIGGVGEALVAGRLREIGWPILRNVVLHERTGSAEIDILARAPGALVVLEVKTWSGRIEGAASAASWTRHGADGRVMILPNAVRQNLAHMAAVERAIGDSQVRVRGVVVSAGHARFVAALRSHVVPAEQLAGVLRDGAESELRETWRIERAWAALCREAARSPERQAGHIAWVRSRDRDAGNCE
jgi:hypothetical protein